MGEINVANARVSAERLKSTRRALDNWGAWQINLASPLRGIPATPAFINYTTVHADAADGRRAYRYSEAERMDAELARMAQRHLDCFICRYVLERSTRQSARLMERAGYHCSHTTFVRWLEEAHEVAARLVHPDRLRDFER